MANPTADWEKVGSKFYRKIQLYTAVFDQELEFENHIVTGCLYGGAIGMHRLSLTFHDITSWVSSTWTSLSLQACVKDQSRGVI